MTYGRETVPHVLQRVHQSIIASYRLVGVRKTHNNIHSHECVYLERLPYVAQVKYLVQRVLVRLWMYNIILYASTTYTILGMIAGNNGVQNRQRIADYNKIGVHLRYEPLIYFDSQTKYGCTAIL